MEATLGVMLVAGLACAAPRHVPVQPPDLVAQGTDALVAGDLQRAEDYFSRALDSDLRNPDAQLGLCRATMEQGRFEPALAHCRSAVFLRGAPQDHRAHAEVLRRRVSACAALEALVPCQSDPACASDEVTLIRQCLSLAPCPTEGNAVEREPWHQLDPSAQALDFKMSGPSAAADNISKFEVRTRGPCEVTSVRFKFLDGKVEKTLLKPPWRVCEKSAAPGGARDWDVVVEDACGHNAHREKRFTHCEFQ
jgi:hypothetical protein